MVAYSSTAPSLEKPALDVSHVSTVPVDLLKDEIAQVIKLKYPDTSEVSLSKSVSSKGINYRKGMIVAHGSTGGLPDFGEVLQMCILHDQLFFIVRELCG